MIWDSEHPNLKTIWCKKAGQKAAEAIECSNSQVARLILLFGELRVLLLIETLIQLLLRHEEEVLHFNAQNNTANL